MFALIIVLAFIAGLLFRALGFPPLVGLSGYWVCRPGLGIG